ncbi:hypothetical protein Bca4012_073055 [Brassica carinata]
MPFCKPEQPEFEDGFDDEIKEIVVKFNFGYACLFLLSSRVHSHTQDLLLFGELLASEELVLCLNRLLL